MDVVIRTPHGEAEVTIARAGEATAIADIVERVTGSASPPIADVDGRAVLTTATIGGSGVVTGSVIDLGATTRPAPQDAMLDLVQVAGWGAGARQTLGPGTYRVGPGRRVNAADLDLAHVDKIAFELSVDADGAAMVTVDEQGVRIDGIGIEGCHGVVHWHPRRRRAGVRARPRCRTERSSGAGGQRRAIRHRGVQPAAATRPSARAASPRRPR